MRDHGTRARYVVNGCRCEPCCEANRAYARYQAKRKRLEGLGLRSGPWAAPYVDTGAARLRVLILRDHGIGRRRLAELAGVAERVVQEIGAGRRTKARRESVDRILAVTIDVARPAPRQLVDAAPTWRLIRWILRDTRWPKARLARELGADCGHLQLGRRRVTFDTAQRVERLAHELLVDLGRGVA